MASRGKRIHRSKSVYWRHDNSRPERVSFLYKISWNICLCYIIFFNVLVVVVKYFRWNLPFKTNEFLLTKLKCYFNNSVDELLNRNVVLKKHDSNGFIFITERNTKKYTDFVSTDFVDRFRCGLCTWLYIFFNLSFFF